jgi:hypothetical protein
VRDAYAVNNAVGGRRPPPRTRAPRLRSPASVALRMPPKRLNAASGPNVFMSSFRKTLATKKQKGKQKGGWKGRLMNLADRAQEYAAKKLKARMMKKAAAKVQKRVGAHVGAAGGWKGRLMKYAEKAQKNAATQPAPAVPFAGEAQPVPTVPFAGEAQPVLTAQEQKRQWWEKAARKTAAQQKQFAAQQQEMQQMRTALNAQTQDLRQQLLDAQQAGAEIAKRRARENRRI